jgi:TolB-like protein
MPAGQESTPAIAVLPFADLSARSDHRYFCDGLAEELIHRLGLVDGLRVSPEPPLSSFAAAPIRARSASASGSPPVGRERAQDRCDRLRITVQLVRVADGQQLWSERFDRHLEDVFAIQEEIAGRVAEELRLALTSGAGRVGAGRQPDNVAAYEYYLRGREYFWRFNSTG